MNVIEPKLVRVVEDRWATIRHIVEAIAIVTAGIWAFYTFVYQEKIKPAGEPASLDASVAVHRLGHDRRRDILGVTLRFHNSGRTEIDVAADAYNVWGRRYGLRPSASRNNVSDHREDSFMVPQISNQLISRFVELRDAAERGRKSAHIILEPDATEDIDRVVVVPTGAYDIIHAQVVAVPVKTSEERTVRVWVVTRNDGGFFLRTAKNSGAVEDDNETDFALIP